MPEAVLQLQQDSQGQGQRPRAPDPTRGGCRVNSSPRPRGVHSTHRDLPEARADGEDVQPVGVQTSAAPPRNGAPGPTTTGSRTVTQQEHTAPPRADAQRTPREVPRRRLGRAPDLVQAPAQRPGPLNRGHSVREARGPGLAAPWLSRGRSWDPQESVSVTPNNAQRKETRERRPWS